MDFFHTLLLTYATPHPTPTAICPLAARHPQGKFKYQARYVFLFEYGAQTCTSQICRFFLPSFGGRMACAFSLEKSKSLYLVIGPMWQKFIYLSIPQYSKTDWPIPLFGPRSSPFMSSDVIFLQAKWSKIKERVEGWKSGKTSRFKRITVCTSI